MARMCDADVYIFRAMAGRLGLLGRRCTRPMAHKLTACNFHKGCPSPREPRNINNLLRRHHRTGGWVQVIKAGESDATRKAGFVMQC